MADGVVQVAADGVGKKIDTAEITVGSNTVERQRIVLADNAVATQIASVTAANALKVDNSAVTQPVSAAGLTNLDVALSTRLKPADTLAAVTSITNAVGITPPTLTKGTQGATGLSTQDLVDAGRNVTNYFMAAPIITTTAEVMQSMTGYKGGVAVGATVSPAVVTAAKTYRVTRITITYWAATVIGGALIRLRANLSGLGVVGSPLVMNWQVGMPAVFTAGAAMTYCFEYPGGLEFAAGTGIAFGVIGEGAVPTTGTITGYVMISCEGYEY